MREECVRFWLDRGECRD